MMTTPTKESTVARALSFTHGGMSKEELECLYDMCGDAKVIEVGSMVGMSSYVIATVAKHLTCCDLWPDAHGYIEPRQREIYEQFSKACPNMWQAFCNNTAPVRDKITPVRGLSWMCAEFCEPANIILFDADHSYEGVKRDFEAFKSKLAPGGYAVFHDYESAMWPGVKQFLDEQPSLKLVGRVGYLAAFTL